MAGYCLKFKEEQKFLCTKDFDSKEIVNNSKEPIELIYTNVTTLKELINYGLTMNYNIEIPESKITTVYHIIFSTGNFEPDDRSRSLVNSSIVFSSTDKNFIEKKMKDYAEQVKGYKHHSISKNWVCWHTEDFAHNQIIHAYNVEKSYIIENVKEVQNEI